MSERVAAHVFPVGLFVLQEMHARDWCIGDLATEMGMDDNEESLIELIVGSRPMTDDDATRLAVALGTTAALWQNLNRRYLLRR